MLPSRRALRSDPGTAAASRTEETWLRAEHRSGDRSRRCETFAGAVADHRASRRSRSRCPTGARREFASGSVSSADNVLVRVHTDAGLVGQAEAQPRPYTYGETQASIVDAVGGPLNAALVGVDPLRIELVAERCAADRRQLRRARRRRPRGLGSRRPDPRAARATRCWAASRTTSRPRTWSRSASRPRWPTRPSRSTSGSASRTFKVKVGRAPALDVAAVRAIRDGAARRRPLRRRQPRLELRRRACAPATRSSSSACGRSRSRSRSTTAPGRLRLAERWARAAGRRRELHQPRARRSRARGGRGARREHQDGADGVHGVAPDPRSVPRAQRPGRRRQPVRGRDRRDGDGRVRRRVRRDRAASRPRSRTSSTSRTTSSSPRRRSATAARRCPRRPGLGFEVDEERLERYRLDR